MSKDIYWMWAVAMPSSFGWKSPLNVLCTDIEVYEHTHVRLDAHMLPFRDNSFDMVLLMKVLEHVNDVEKVLKEALRILRDIEIIRKYCEKELTLDYELYPGWGFVCYKRDLN